MTRTERRLQSLIAQTRAEVAARPQDPAEPPATPTPDEPQPQRARWWLTYPGDARGMVGQVVAEGSPFGEDVVAVVAHYPGARFEVTVDGPVTRVGFALATSHDVAAWNRYVDAEHAKQAHLHDLLGGRRVASA